MVTVDGLIIDPSIDELNGESLLRDTLRFLEESKIFRASRLIEETSKTNRASGLRIRRVVDVVQLFETSRCDQSGAASVDCGIGGTRGGTTGGMKSGTTGGTRDGTVGGTIEIIEVAVYKFPHRTIHPRCWTQRDRFSKISSRRNKIDVGLEIVRNGILCGTQLLNAVILIVIECGTEKSIRRGNRSR